MFYFTYEHGPKRKAKVVAAVYMCVADVGQDHVSVCDAASPATQETDTATDGRRWKRVVMFFHSSRLTPLVLSVVA